MSIQKYVNVSNIFSGKKFNDEKENELFRETLILTLSRMTRADLNTEPAEVEAVVNYVKDATGAEISDATVRTAASSELFESAPLHKQLKKVAKYISAEHRLAIVKGLALIIGSDGRVSDNETELFNTLVSALDMTPAQLVGFGAGS